MAADNSVELVIRARNLSDHAFAQATGNVKKLRQEVNTTTFGRLESSMRQFDDVLELVGGPHLRDAIQGVGQLGDVATGASGKLDGLAKAGLIASAAIGGWSIGRKLAELTGSDTLIGNLTAKLMGWGDVAGQQAAAGAETLARASKNAGRQITDMTEAIQINEAAAKAHSDAIQRAQGPAVAAKQIADWRKEIDALRAAGSLEGLRKQVEDGSIAQGDLAKMFGISADALKLFSGEVKKSTQAHGEAARAADAHAKAIQSVRDNLSGAGLVEAANKTVEALKGMDSIHTLTRDKQLEIAETMDAAIEVYKAAGKRIPEAWLLIGNAARMAAGVTVTSIESTLLALDTLEAKLAIPIAAPPALAWTKGIDNILKDLPNRIGSLSIPKVPLFEKIFGTPKEFGAQMASTIVGALQGGGNVLHAAGGLLGTKLGTSIGTKLGAFFGKEGAGMFSKALGGMFSAVLPGLGALMGPLLGKIGGAIAGLFDRNKGRDVVEAFANSVGGFDALHRQLNALGDEGERLWIRLTQGVGRNNPEQARAAVDAVTRALAEHERKVTEDAAAVEAASARVSAAQQEALDQAKDALKQLDDEIASLQKSIDSEAPEEVMGVVEAQQRARLEALQEEREAAAQHVEELQAKLTESMDRVAAAIENLPRDIEIGVRLRYEDGGFDGPRGTVPQHAVGAYIRQDHLAQVHAGEIVGPVDFIARAMQQAGGVGRGGDIHVRLELDGDVLTRTVVRRMPDAVRRFGVR